MLQYSGGTNPSATTSLAYDAFGVRVSKRKLTTSPAVLDESVLYVGKLFEAQNFKDPNRFVGTPEYDVTRSLFRVFGDGQLVAEVVHDGASGGQKKAHYFMLDHQGSVVYRTEGAVDGMFGAGEMRGYFPFGKRWAAFEEKLAFSSIGYTGHVHDDDLGLINMSGRLYDTEQLRFISRDPVLMPDALGGTNAYSYVLNDPMNLVDPTGFASERPCGADEVCIDVDRSSEPTWDWGFDDPCVGDVCAFDDVNRMSGALTSVTNNYLGGGPATGPGTGLSSAGAGDCIGETCSDSDDYEENPDVTPPPGGWGFPPASGSGSGQGSPSNDPVQSEPPPPGASNGKDPMTSGEPPAPRDDPRTMNDVEIKPMAAGQYGPPMTRDMYLNVLDRQQGLQDTAQITDLLPINRLGGLAKSLLKGVGAKATSSAITRMGSHLNTVDDVIANPSLLRGLQPQDVMLRLQGRVPEGWAVETLGKGAHKGQGWMLRHYTSAGHPTGLQVRWHPGGGHHGPGAYWRVVGPNGSSGVIR